MLWRDHDSVVAVVQLLNINMNSKEGWINTYKIALFTRQRYGDRCWCVDVYLAVLFSVKTERECDRDGVMVQMRHMRPY